MGARTEDREVGREALGQHGADDALNTSLPMRGNTPMIWTTRRLQKGTQEVTWGWEASEKGERGGLGIGASDKALQASSSEKRL